MTSCGNQKTHHHVHVTESGFVPFLLLVRNNLNFSQLSMVVWSRLSDIPCASSVEYRHACMCVQALTFTLTEASASKFWAWWNIVLKAALHKRIWRLQGNRLNTSQRESALTAKKVVCILGWISKSAAGTSKEIIVLLYSVLSEEHAWNTVFIFALRSTRWAVTYYEPSKDHQAGQRAGGLWYMRRGWEDCGP